MLNSNVSFSPGLDLTVQEYDIFFESVYCPAENWNIVLNQLYARTVFYPTLWWNMLLGRVLKIRNWWDSVDESLILGAYPFAGDVEKLADEGVRSVVNTCEEYSGPVAAYKKFGIEQLRIPTTDFTHPKLNDVEKAVEFINQSIKTGGKVYVHCKAGRARSATVVACWLIKHRGMSAKEAQKTMSRARPHVNPQIDKRPVVMKFEATCRANSEIATAE